jgi:hypothetical protein
MQTLGSTPSFSLSYREIKTNGCPNHPNFCTGNPWRDNCGPIGAEGNDTNARELAKQYRIMAYPVFALTPMDLRCKRGALGIAYNGVAISGMSLSYVITT